MKHSLLYIVLFTIALLQMEPLFCGPRVHKITTILIPENEGLIKQKQLTSSTEIVTAQDNKRKAQEYLESLLAKRSLPGISAAVSKNGKLIWAGNVGTTNIKNDLLPDTNTIYRIGSVSKVISTALLMKMVQEGKVDLDAPIKKWLTNLPEDKKEITLRQLSNHTSGIRHYYTEETEPNRPYPSAYAALDLFINDRLQAQPGDQWLYSSYGINLMVAVLEKASQTSFPELIRKEIFEPLGMKNSHSWGISTELEHFSEFYNSNNQSINDDISYKWAGGGLLSSTRDLISFGNVHIKENVFFNKETLSEIFRPQFTSNDTINYQGIGWRIDELSNGNAVYYHDGHISGGHAHLSIQPKDGIVCVILSNKGTSFGVKEGNDLVNILLGKKLTVEGAETEKQRFMKILKEYNSAYEILKTSFKNADIKMLDGIVDTDFKSETWQSKDIFIQHMKKEFSQGGIVLNEANMDVKFSGTTIGSNIELYNLKYSSGFKKNQSIVFQYDGQKVKIITVIEH